LDNFESALKDCRGSKSIYGPQIDNVRTNMKNTYSLNCGQKCAAGDNKCQCTQDYTPAANKYSQCQTQKVGDRDHYCDCLKTYLKETKSCKGTKLDGQITAEENRYDKDCSSSSSDTSTTAQRGATSTTAQPGATVSTTESQHSTTKNDCTTTYVKASGQYQSCTSKNDAKYKSYTEAEKKEVRLGNNPHPNCQCVKDYSDKVRHCKSDPTWAASINAFLRGVNQATWMRSCRKATCEAFACAAGTHLKANAASIRCTGQGGDSCDTSADQSTCCDSGPGKAPCNTWTCPSGYNPKINAASLTCAGTSCSADADRDTCCDKANCPGAITFDYRDKQGQCAAVGSVVTAGASKCYNEQGCAAMTACYAKEACKHKDMSKECASKLRICAIKPGGTIYSHHYSGSTSSHCSNGNCATSSHSTQGGISSDQCDTNVNSDAHSVSVC